MPFQISTLRKPNILSMRGAAAFAEGALHHLFAELAEAGAAIAVMALLFLFLRFTRTGKMMRAVADNPALANLKGINPVTVARIANFLGFIPIRSGAE